MHSCTILNRMKGTEIPFPPDRVQAPCNSTIYPTSIFFDPFGKTKTKPSDYQRKHGHRYKKEQPQDKPLKQEHVHTNKRQKENKLLLYPKEKQCNTNILTKQYFKGTHINNRYSALCLSPKSKV